MPQNLTDMTIDEISLVDEGANGEARIVIFKSKHDESAQSGHTDPDGSSGNPDPAGFAADQLKEHDMDIETLSKALEDAEAKLVALEKRTTDAEAALTDAQAVIKTRDDEIAELKKSATPDGEDDVLKALPEEVRKRLSDAEAEIKKMRDDAEQKEAVAKAREMGVSNPDDVGPLLLRVRKGMTTEGDAATIEAMLKAHAEVEKKSALFKSLGTTESVDGDPESILKAKASEIMEANKGMTYEQAYVKAMEQNPAVYNAYVSKRRAA